MQYPNISFVGIISCIANSTTFDLCTHRHEVSLAAQRADATGRKVSSLRFVCSIMLNHIVTRTEHQMHLYRPSESGHTRSGQAVLKWQYSVHLVYSLSKISNCRLTYHTCNFLSHHRNGLLRRSWDTNKRAQASTIFLRARCANLDQSTWQAPAPQVNLVDT